MSYLAYPSYSSARSDPSLPKMATAAAHIIEDPADDARLDLTGYEECIDQPTFEQILEMDDDREREFSRSIVYGFFDQAESTFVKMEIAISKHELLELSQLGHFLKGSSATLGLTKIKDACEKIQHYGAGRDVSGLIDEPDEAKSLSNIKKTLVEVKEAYNEVVKLLKRYYGDTTSS